VNRGPRTGATVTDLYEVTMALAYLREDLTVPATFSLFSRALPAERGFLVVAGLADVLDHLDLFAIDESDIAELAAAANRPEADLAPLSGTRFTGEVRAVPEGSVVFAAEPLLEMPGGTARRHARRRRARSGGRSAHLVDSEQVARRAGRPWRSHLPWREL